MAQLLIWLLSHLKSLFYGTVSNINGWAYESSKKSGLYVLVYKLSFGVSLIGLPPVSSSSLSFHLWHTRTHHLHRCTQPRQNNELCQEHTCIIIVIISVIVVIIFKTIIICIIQIIIISLVRTTSCARNTLLSWCCTLNDIIGGASKNALTWDFVPNILTPLNNMENQDHSVDMFITFCASFQTWKTCQSWLREQLTHAGQQLLLLSNFSGSPGFLHFEYHS